MIKKIAKRLVELFTPPGKPSPKELEKEAVLSGVDSYYLEKRYNGSAEMAGLCFMLLFLFSIISAVCSAFN